MSPDMYHYLLKNQGGGCAICGAKPQGTKSLPVDHDHATDRVRGILCQNCNTGLGHFKDKPELLRAAIAYLERQA